MCPSRPSEPPGGGRQVLLPLCACFLSRPLCSPAGPCAGQTGKAGLPERQGAMVGAGPSVLGTRNRLCARHAVLFLSPPAAAARAPDTRGACPPLDALARGSQDARPEAPDTEAGARPLNTARETLSRRRRLSSRRIWIRVLSHSAQRPSVRAACAALSGVCLPTRTPRPGPGTRQASGGGADWPVASGGWMDRQTPH